MYGKRPDPRSRDSSLDLAPRWYQVREASPHPLQTCLRSHDQTWAPRDRAMATQSSRRSWGWIPRNRVRLIPGYTDPVTSRDCWLPVGSCTLPAHPLTQKVTFMSAPRPAQPLGISSPLHCFPPPTKYLLAQTLKWACGCRGELLALIYFIHSIQDRSNLEGCPLEWLRSFFDQQMLEAN